MLPTSGEPQPATPSIAVDPLSLDLWDFALPDDRIARFPAEERAASRLLHLARGGTGHEDRVFADLPDLLAPGDLLVANDTRVMRARLYAQRASGARIEVLVLEPGPGPVRAMLRPLKRLKDGEVLTLADGTGLTVLDRLEDGVARVAFDGDVADVMARNGEIPLPPYLGRGEDPTDPERYQTVFAGPLGAAAAPTAGLHFDEPLLGRLRERGIGFATVTLHVGIGTFRPLRPEDVDRGELHEERYAVPQGTADRIAATRAAGGKIIAVGTTSARTLEAATPPGARLPVAGAGATTLFVRPPYAFRSIDGLITNFHLPRSSLLMLVASLVGRERLLAAYQHAVDRGYRFYSYGDAMLVL